MNILVSGCLLGLNCKYNGSNNYCADLLEIKDKYNLIPICPEIFGGMCTPREPSEILGDKVMNILGKDVTLYFKKGADEALKLAKIYNCRYAILKEYSPSCGCGEIYDGSFSKKLIVGDGITARLFLENGITIIRETEIKEKFSTS